jgi:sec-independent protein translocase protein TatB
VFGLGFGEMIVLGVVLLVVVGPRDLPRMLRTVGRGITKLRRMSTDLREQSGIDEIIQDEGLREDIDAIRSLSRDNVVESFVRQASRPSAKRRAAGQIVPTAELAIPGGPPPRREQEYPLVGCDGYGALADDEPYSSDESAPPQDDDPYAENDEDDAAEDPT